MVQPASVPAMEFLCRPCQECLFFFFFSFISGAGEPVSRRALQTPRVFPSRRQPPEHVHPLMGVAGPGPLPGRWGSRLEGVSWCTVLFYPHLVLPPVPSTDLRSHEASAHAWGPTFLAPVPCLQGMGYTLHQSDAKPGFYQGKCLPGG